MRANTIRFSKQAIKDTDEAISWYRERSNRAAEDFVLELERATANIMATPHRWSEFRPGLRRLRLSRFPYWIVYREMPMSTVQIVAVAHMRRRPGYWLGRSM